MHLRVTMVDIIWQFGLYLQMLAVPIAIKEVSSISAHG